MNTALLFLSLSLSQQFHVSPDFQEDFSKAQICQWMIGDNYVWKGERAYYIQVSKDAVATIFLTNSPKALRPFRQACE